MLYWLFGGACCWRARLFMGRNLMRRLLDKQIALPDAVWDHTLNLSWALFFAAAGAANLYVAFSGHFSETQWVS